ncbi:MAG: DUF1501 domain-containing protein, partial [Mycobacteriales bacterium]
MECTDLICTRRRLLTGLGLAAGVVAVDTAMPRLAFAASPARGDLLVVVSLRGGADGLSLVPPIGDPSYLTARPSIGVTSEQALRLDRTFGLHPGLKPLLPYWSDRRLAIVQAVGDKDGTRSHFEATDAMERGVDVSSGVTTGWIDRYLTVRGLRSTDFPSLAIGSSPPGTLAGPAPDLTTQDVRNLGIRVAKAKRPAIEQALGQMYAGLGGPVASAARGTLSALAAFAPFREVDYQPRGGAVYPADGLGYALKQVAQVARAGIGLEVATVDGGGWDTHEGMGGAGGGYMATQVGRLGQALAAFAADLGPLLATTTIVTVSEFGRRVAQNGSGGVD